MIKNSWNKGKDSDLTARMQEELMKMKSEQIREPQIRANSFSGLSNTYQPEKNRVNPLANSMNCVLPPRPPRPVSDNLSRKPPVPPRRSSNKDPQLRVNIGNLKNRPQSMKTSPQSNNPTPLPHVLPHSPPRRSLDNKPNTRASCKPGPSPLATSARVLTGEGNFSADPQKKPPPPPPRRQSTSPL